MTNTATPFGQDSVELVGRVKIVTPRRSNDIGLSQAIGNVQGKYNEYTIPHGNSGSPFVVPLNLSNGITEALMVILNCSMKLLLTLTSSDATHGGPFNLGILGQQVLTLYPGEGITGISVVNPDTANDALLEVGIVSLASVTDQPTFWYPQNP